MKNFPALEHEIQQLVADRITPCVLYSVQRKGKPFFEKIYGTTRYNDPLSRPLRRDDIFDIASITKIITATAMMILLDRKEIYPNDTLDRYITQPTTFGSTVTIWNLLTHTSGIGIQMSKLTQADPSLLIPEAIAHAEFEFPTGTQIMFTNVNTYLLGKIIEKVSGVTLDVFLHDELFEPLGMTSTCFNPSSELLDRIVPTEITEHRGCIWGTVHDRSAFLLGGVVGHAGLFSTVDDLHAFNNLWINKGMCGNQRILSERIMNEAMRHQVEDLSPGVGLGWALHRVWMGDATIRSCGHHAFTGPSIVIDMVSETSVVTLMNRTYPHVADMVPDRQRHEHQGRINSLLFHAINQLL